MEGNIGVIMKEKHFLGMHSYTETFVGGKDEAYLNVQNDSCNCWECIPQAM